ncbi:CGNR zinc finger domain-containing protein [Terrarubrum flagellatum]|uniref:CGNR zinc finger domain-containing protein n=1 Tax=Terrirubrum flagellatum TaxID=2895980 RepID=UPI003144E9D9
MVKATISSEGRAGSLDLIGGALALDFANTSSGRGGPQHLDHLRAAADVVVWARHVGAIGEAAAALLEKALASGDPRLAELLPQALALREAIHRVGGAIASKAKPDPADLEILHQAVARAVAGAKLAPSGDGYRWTFESGEPRIESVLGPIALSAVGLLRDGDLSRLKKCGGEHCGWLFFDLTKNKSRRWCEMSVCGNRSKARTRRMRATKVG